MKWTLDLWFRGLPKFSEIQSGGNQLFHAVSWGWLAHRSDVGEDCEREGDADDGEEEAEDAAARRARRDVAVPWIREGGGLKMTIGLYDTCHKCHYPVFIVNTKQWKKEQSRHCCTANVWLRRSVNQLYSNQFPKLIFFPLLCKHLVQKAYSRLGGISKLQSSAEEEDSISLTLNH